MPGPIAARTTTLASDLPLPAPSAAARASAAVARLEACQEHL